MKTFKNYIAETADSHSKLVAKLEKTYKSIRNHIMRGGASHHSHGQDLSYRYDTIKNKLQETPEGDAHWKKYCAKHGFDPSHDGRDNYA
jgi:hypothetical protein